jgi:hypothetical protein
VFLVRLLFCLFAEDNAIFERQQFKELIELRSTEDGSDLAALLANLFQVLNTPPERRLKNLDEQLAAFAYINGKLFAESLAAGLLRSKMRERVLDCTTLNWSGFRRPSSGRCSSPSWTRRPGGTSGPTTPASNILKALQPLFLDALRAEFERVKRDKKRLVGLPREAGQYHEFLTRPAAAATSWSLPTASSGCWSWMSCANAFKAASSDLLDVSQHHVRGRGPVLRHRD